MRYHGGKAKTCKLISMFINIELKNNQTYWEPFCGACNVITRVKSSRIRIATDIHPDLIMMWNSLKNGWIPPDEVSEELYHKLQYDESSALRGFTGFGCSFGGRWFHGYARSNSLRNYALEAHGLVLKKIQTLKDVNFHCCDYRDFVVPDGCLIYCDPPYRFTERYSSGDFNHEAFWEWVRMKSVNNYVLVSEYMAPKDFKCVMEYDVRVGLRGDLGNCAPAISRNESLFRIIKK